MSRTTSNDLSDVEKAEFYLGKYWEGNNAYVVHNSGERLGISTSAYGQTLCVCRITFRDGRQAHIERMIDFGMAITFGGEA